MYISGIEGAEQGAAVSEVRCVVTKITAFPVRQPWASWNFGSATC